MLLAGVGARAGRSANRRDANLDASARDSPLATRRRNKGLAALRSHAQIRGHVRMQVAQIAPLLLLLFARRHLFPWARQLGESRRAAGPLRLRVGPGRGWARAVRCGRSPLVDTIRIQVHTVCELERSMQTALQSAANANTLRALAHSLANRFIWC